MAFDNEHKIKKITLSDGSVFSIFDEGSLHLDAQNRIMTGNAVVDSAISTKGLMIRSIDDVPLADVQGTILVRDSTTGLIKQQDIRQVLKNLGLITGWEVDLNNTLSLTKFDFTYSV